MSEQCPKCGAPSDGLPIDSEQRFMCGSFSGCRWFSQSDGCALNVVSCELEAMTAERDALAEQLAEAKAHVEYLIKQRQWCEG